MTDLHNGCSGIHPPGRLQRVRVTCPPRVTIAFAALVGASPLATASPAVPTTVAGHVERATPRWAAGGDTIVTDIDVRQPDGTIVHAVGLGGVMDGIGIGYSHAPRLPQPGEDVMLIGARTTANAPLAIQRVAALSPRLAPAVAGAASYGVRRTVGSGIPLQPPSYTDIVYDAAGTTDIPGDQEFPILDAAFATWSKAAAGCGTISFKSWISPDVTSASDGISTVVFRQDTWCRPATNSEPELCYPPEAAATTRLVWVDDPFDDKDGQILEADMEINAVDYAFATGGVTSSTDGEIADLGDVVTHEVGHVLGLMHNCWEEVGARQEDFDGTPVPDCTTVTAGSPTTLATMYYVMLQPDETLKQTLEAGDREGVCALAANAHSDPVDVIGGCQSGRDPGPWSIGMIAALWSLIRRKRSSTRPLPRRR